MVHSVPCSPLIGAVRACAASTRASPPPTTAAWPTACTPGTRRTTPSCCGRPGGRSSSSQPLGQLVCVQEDPAGRGGDRELPARVVRAARPPHHPQVSSDWRIVVVLSCDWCRDTWYFTCSCARCEDATEFGTNISAFKCQMCCEGLVLPATNSIGGNHLQTEQII